MQWPIRGAVFVTTYMIYFGVVLHSWYHTDAITYPCYSGNSDNYDLTMLGAGFASFLGMTLSSIDLHRAWGRRSMVSLAIVTLALNALLGPISAWGLDELGRANNKWLESL